MGSQRTQSLIFLCFFFLVTPCLAVQLCIMHGVNPNLKKILYLSFFKKFIQCLIAIQQIIHNSSNKNNSHTLESLHLVLESNYKFVPWLKKFEKVYSSSFFVRHHEFQYSDSKAQCSSENSIIHSVTRVALPKLHLLISNLLEDQSSFFSAS